MARLKMMMISLRDLSDSRWGKHTYKFLTISSGTVPRKSTLPFFGVKVSSLRSAAAGRSTVSL
jgi:hypothetical protein